MRYSGVISFVWALLLAVGLSGCEQLGIKMNSAGSDDDTVITRHSSANTAVSSIGTLSPEQAQMLQLMGYSRIMQTYPHDKLKAEFKRVATELAENPVTINQIRMAILLSIPNTSFQSDERAMQLLSNIVNMGGRGSSLKDTLPGPLRDPLQNPLQEYAHVLLDNLKQRTDDAQAYKQLAEELQAERQKRDQLLQVERQKRDQLQKQLDALRSIEKSINQRQLKNEADK